MSVNTNPQGFEPTDGLRDVVRVSPWLVLGILYEWTDGQWNDLATGQTFIRLQSDLTLIARETLSGYPKLPASLASDVAGDVLLKLVEGRFLKRFERRSGRPRAYLLGAGRQLARVLVRSLWRQYLRDNGLPPMKSRSSQPTPHNTSQHEAA